MITPGLHVTKVAKVVSMEHVKFLKNTTYIKPSTNRIYAVAIIRVVDYASYLRTR